jgi:glycosyltransferase involved in cell wall biosynthesis
VRILYVSQYFPPEIGAPAVRVHDLARFWVQSGHDVTVLTGFPNHPNGVLHPEYRGKLRRLTVRESLDGINVVRSWLIPLPNRKASERILNYSSFYASAALRGLFLKKFDVVIATSPQLLVGLAGLTIARMRGAKFVFEVRDLWPESLVATGVSGGDSFLYRSLRRISARLYRKADHVVVVTPAFQSHIEKNYNCEREKIDVIPNGVDLEWFENARAAYVPEERSKFVVSFIGTIGHAHGVDTILRAAEKLRHSHPDVLFRIVGDGAEREKIEAAIAAQRIENVELVKQQPRSRVPALIWDSDACLVLLKRSEVFKTVIPTKMLEFMACGRPVILGVEGQALDLMEEARGGIAIPPEDADALAAAALRLKADPSLCVRLGANGKEFIANRMSRKTTASDYERLLMRVIGHVLAEEPRPARKAAGTN